MKGLPDLHRRGLLRLSGGGLLAGFMGATPVKVPPMLAPLASGSGAAPRDGHTAAGREGWRLFDFWKGHRAPNAYAYKVRNGSTDLDPDIACLRSVSPCMKAWMQRERDTQVQEQIGLVAKLFGVEP